MSIGKRTSKSDAMFKFSTKLFFRKDGICKSTGDVSIAIEIYISTKGNYERSREPLDIRWPHDKIDRDNSMLLPRSRNDEDVNDYNMIIMSERSKYNEVAKIYRLTDRVLTIKALKREVLFLDSNKSVVGYCTHLRNDLYKKKVISRHTWAHYGSTIKRIEEFDLSVRFDQVNKKWIDKFKCYLKDVGNSHNTIWTRVKELKAMLHHAAQEVTIHVDESALTYRNVSIENPIIYLNRSEVKLLQDLYYSNSRLTSIETNVLRGFLFSCFSSLRISDIYAAHTNWMMSDSFLTFTMQKNKERRPKTIRIPIAPIAKILIADVLEGKIFELPTQQEYNRTLKDIAKIVGLKKNLTSHVGRHTFGFLFMTSVGDIYALKEIMGHTKIETTMRYAHLDDETKMAHVMKMEAGLSG